MAAPGSAAIFASWWGCADGSESRGPAGWGVAFAAYKRFVPGKTLAEAEFTSAGHLKFPRVPKKKHLQSRCFFFGGATQI